MFNKKKLRNSGIKVTSICFDIVPKADLYEELD